ncbi:hypothetical protein D3C80_734210 [compost metagenome]
MVALEHETEGLTAQPGQLVAVQLGDVLAGEQVVTGGRTIQATENVHQGRLAGAGRTDNGDELARVDRQADTSHHFDLRGVDPAV